MSAYLRVERLFERDAYLVVIVSRMGAYSKEALIRWVGSGYSKGCLTGALPYPDIRTWPYKWVTL